MKVHQKVVDVKMKCIERNKRMRINIFINHVSWWSLLFFLFLYKNLSCLIYYNQQDKLCLTMQCPTAQRCWYNKTLYLSQALHNQVKHCTANTIRYSIWDNFLTRFLCFAHFPLRYLKFQWNSMNFVWIKVKWTMYSNTKVRSF